LSTVIIYIINILLLVAISCWSYGRYKSSPLKKYFWPALLFKISCGVLLGQLFYIYYEGGDTIRYYTEAVSLSNLEFSSFYSAISEGTLSSQPVRAIYFVRFVAVIKFLTHADYWLLSAYFSLFSFLGAFYFSSKLMQWKEGLKTPVILSFLFFPSLVFWSSGLLKDSLAFGSLTFLLGTYFSWYQNRKLHLGNVLICLVAFVIIVSFKYYIAAVLIPLLFYLTLYYLPIWEKWGITVLWKKTGLLVASLTIPMLVFFVWLSPNLSYQRLWQIMQQNHDAYIRLAPEGAVYTLDWFGNSLDVLVNLSYLWFSGLFRPLIGEGFHFPVILSSLENGFLLAGSVISTVHFFRHNVKWTAELLATLVYISILSIFLSYATPNFGTLARYKIYYAPFFVMLITYQLQSLPIFRKN